MTPSLRLSAWIWVFACAAACGGKGSDVFDDQGAGGDGSEETGGFSNAGDGFSGDDGVGGSGASSTGGTTAVTGGAAPTGGKRSNGGTNAGGASAVGGAPSEGGRIGGGGVFPGGAIGVGGTFGGIIGAGGTPVLGGRTSVGGTSSGGSAGGATSECVDPDGADYKRQGTSKGSNGDFEDHCDGGDLIEYVCETGARPCPQPSSSGPADAAAPALPLPVGGGSGIALPPQCLGNTGRVVEMRVACGGRCDQGTCFGWCPGAGDELTYQEVAGGEVVIDNDTKDARYRCESSSSTGQVDCVAPALEGETAEVDALVSCSTAVVSFVARLSANATCSYRCSLVD